MTAERLDELLREDESREATHEWIDKFNDPMYAHGLADDVFDLKEALVVVRERAERLERGLRDIAENGYGDAAKIADAVLAEQEKEQP